MKYSKATNYALHTMLHLALSNSNKPIGVQILAQQQKVSPTYLSKILTKLVKEGMVASASGANGGYSLTKGWESISFLDIIYTIEGKSSLFDCDFDHGSHCPIQKVMLRSEEKMEEELRKQTIADLILDRTTT
ncbi:Rrf2 family transcriptional regulator [Peribacillus psychrosaccharolyticus]|uniref:Rrf2 family transcriptional regulator n=1 Tax=Peribacillus psychrosaccharolyticus TaxID=1407 RepID=A0A974NML6_PERPY|nr:Rrf2 family transcriptional regulator [Peribacillus psychrosaccharolyticus]MEC2056114.1 Rrf2 family transcriptional regulator [Peribacillus psychrosaccharolyticus]MED3745555.1 Rrf2 family transcriptional regulator [Peribacillus psychrosaccharolyticus]QQT00692.1 Rrf2 family transcriptional regulator [Peribacillus psychrosaccharolyticus]